jgi:hypothetical protein
MESCFRVGLLALPLPGAGVTFFAAAKKVTKESSGVFNRSMQHLCSNKDQRKKANETTEKAVVEQRGQATDLAAMERR